MLVTSMKGYGYQWITAPRISVKASHASGNSNDNFAMRAEVSPRGPKATHPITASSGTIDDGAGVQRYDRGPLAGRNAIWLRDQPAMRARTVRAAECGRDGQSRDCGVDVALKCPALRGR